jgi:rubrerythrin
MRMSSDDAARLRGVLDRMVREKEIAAAFFARVAECLDDVEQRRWFRRMAQDEKDQRKILLKHRRELCGGVVVTAPAAVSQIHQALEAAAREGEADYAEALRLAVRGADESQALYSHGSDVVGDRSCRIFLKILSEESRSHRDELHAELRRVEAHQAEPVEGVAA